MKSTLALILLAPAHHNIYLLHPTRVLVSPFVQTDTVYIVLATTTKEEVDSGKEMHLFKQANV